MKIFMVSAPIIVLLAAVASAQKLPLTATSSLTASQSVPPSTSTATGVCKIAITNAANTATSGSFALTLSSTQGLGQVHLHAGGTQTADIGGVTPRIANLADFTGQAATSYTAANPLANLFTLLPPIVATGQNFQNLAANITGNNLYCDIHFTNQANGNPGSSAIRGNLTPLPAGTPISG